MRLMRLALLPVPFLAAADLAAQIPQGTPGRFEGWNITYPVPAGWQFGRTMGRIHVLTSMQHAGAVFVAPGLYETFDEMAGDVVRFYQAMGLAGSPVEPAREATFGGHRAMASVYASYDQTGRIVHARIVTLLTPHGTGLIAIGMTTPQQMPQLRRTVEQLAAGVTAEAPQVNQQAVAALAGRWMYYAGRADGAIRPSGGASRSVEEYVTFDGRGNFEWQSSASVNVITPGFSGAAGAANATSDRGTYTVIGTTLVMKGQGGQYAFQLQILADRIIADGRTYLRAN